MSVPPPTLHLICGKMAAGKSTLAKTLADAPDTVLIAEDDWLPALYPEDLKSLDDYVRCSRRLGSVMGPHVAALLRLGVSVVLDFPANTQRQRAWMRGIVDSAGCRHVLHHLDLPDDVCKARLAARNAAGSHAFAPSEADFDLFTKYFEAPSPDEGFDVTVHTGQ